MDVISDSYRQTLFLAKQYWAVVIGILVMYVPTVVDFMDEIWSQSNNAHGPIILVIVIWLLWSKRQAVSKLESKPATFSGSFLLGFGCLLYILGRSQSIAIFEAGSAIPVLAGITLLLKGKQAAKTLWFPFAFLIFLVPLPGFVVDALTNPLKYQVSVIVNELLYTLGYPIGRNGVVLTIGPYQLLIADACSGLNSMFALTALGMLYIYLQKMTVGARSVLLLLSIIPIAFVANVARVTVLCLVTFYFGDGIGLSFSHDFAAILEFIFALFSLFFFDKIIVSFIK